MLDVNDISKLKSVFATKVDFNNLATKKDLAKFLTKKDFSNAEDRMLKIFATKQDVKELRKDINSLRESVQALVVAVDSLAKSISDLSLEYAAISIQLSRHDRWIKQIAEKVGLHLAAE